LYFQWFPWENSRSIFPLFTSLSYPPTEWHPEQSYPKFSLVTLAELPSQVERESSPFRRSYQMPRLTRRGPGIHFIKKLIVPVGVAGRTEMICRTADVGVSRDDANSRRFKRRIIHTSKSCDALAAAVITNRVLCGLPSTKHSYLIPVFAAVRLNYLTDQR
jgi:hypothetical protein